MILSFVNIALYLAFQYFISFSCFVLEATTSSTILNRSDKSRHLCLVPNLKRKSIQSATIKYHVKFFRCFSTGWGSSCLFLVGWNFLSWMIVYFIKYLFCIYVFFSFSLLIWWVTLTYFEMLNQPCIPGTNSLGHHILSFLYSAWFNLPIFS